MTVATADRVQLAYASETDWGQVPDPAPTLQNLRFVDESFSQETATERSREIRADRMVENMFRTNINAAGQLNFELSYGTYDDFILGALAASSFSSGQDILDTAASCTFSGSTITLDSGTWDNTPTVGSWIRVAGASEDANNGFFYVSAATTSEITVDGTLTDETVSVTIEEGEQAVNGVSHPSFILERYYSDLASDAYVLYRGLMVDTMSLSIQTESLITGNFGFIGKDEQSQSDTSGDGSNTAATTTKGMNVITDIFNIRENNASVGITQLTFDTNNNLRQRSEVGELGPTSLGKGKFELSGTMQMYFETKAIMDRYLNFTETSIAAITKDVDDNYYVLEIPSLYYTQGRRVAGGENSDIIADMAFTSKRSSTRDYMLKVVKFSAS